MSPVFLGLVFLSGSDSPTEHVVRRRGTVVQHAGLVLCCLVASHILLSLATKFYHIGSVTY